MNIEPVWMTGLDSTVYKTREDTTNAICRMGYGYNKSPIKLYAIIDSRKEFKSAYVHWKTDSDHLIRGVETIYKGLSLYETREQALNSLKKLRRQKLLVW